MAGALDAGRGSFPSNWRYVIFNFPFFPGRLGQIPSDKAPRRWVDLEAFRQADRFHHDVTVVP